MADREILISTAIDTSGFETDAQKLQQAAQRTADSIGKTFEDLKSKLSKKDVLDLNYWEDRNGKGHTQFNDRDVLGAYDFIESNGGVVDSWADIVDAMRDYKTDAAIAVNERKKQIKAAKEEAKAEKKAAKEKKAETKEQKKATKSNTGFGQSLKKGIGALLKWGVILQILRKVFSAIRQAAKEGINNLVQVDKNLNKSMSAMKSSMTQLKNSIGTMIAPLIQMVEPFITKLLGWLTQAFNKAAELMAALAGQKTFKKAIAVQEDYAAAVAKTQANLSGLDEIKTFDDNNGNANVEDMFKDATVGIDISFDSLKEKISNWWSSPENSRSLGESLSRWISNALGNIDFVALFGNVASSISSGISNVLAFIGGFLEQTDWQSMGKKTWQSIKNYIANIDWTELTEEIARGLGAAIGAVGGFIYGFFTDLWKDVKIAWEKVKGYFNRKIEGAGGNVIEGFFTGIGDAVINIGTWIYNHIFLPFWNGLKNAFGIHSPSTKMEEIGGFIVLGLFKGIGKIKEWWNKLKERIGKAMETLKNILKTPLNAIISFINKFVQGVTNGINKLIESVNKVKIDVPEWMEKITGMKTIGFNIKTLTAPQIPLLASGAVIPPNAPFMAMLGDQKRGTNIEAPLDTIKEAVAEVVGGGGVYQFTAQINRKTLFDEIIEEGRIRRTATGRNPFQMA